jgi:hypothetical protein
MGRERAEPGSVPPSNETQHRVDWDHHRELVRKTNRARKKAIDQLIEENGERFDALYRMTAAAENPPVEPYGRRGVETARQIKARLKRLQAKLDKLEGDGDGQG